MRRQDTFIPRELDVLYNEDGQLKRVGNSAQNSRIINKVALGLIENENTNGVGLEGEVNTQVFYAHLILGVAL